VTVHVVGVDGHDRGAEPEPLFRFLQPVAHVLLNPRQAVGLARDGDVEVAPGTVGAAGDAAVQPDRDEPGRGRPATTSRMLSMMESNRPCSDQKRAWSAAPIGCSFWSRYTTSGRTR
jgi:hypothetical protein